MPDETTPHAQVRERLYDVLADDDLTQTETQRRALALGRDALGAEHGHIRRLTADGTLGDISVSVGDASVVPSDGATSDAASACCRQTREAQFPLAHSAVLDQDAAAAHDGGCVLGTTIVVAGEAYGTVCFLFRDARHTEITAAKETVVELLAQGLGRDIEATQHEGRIQAETRARERLEEKYAALVDAMPAAVFLLDPEQQTITEVSQQAAALTGYDVSELRGMSVARLYPDEHREKYAALFALPDGQARRSQFDDGTPLLLCCADGSRTPVEVSLTTVTVGDTEHIQGVVRDISDVQARKRDLERTSDLIRQTQAVADIGGWEFDPRTETLRWTDEVYRIHGLPLDYEPTVADALEFYHPDDRPQVATAVERLLAEGEPYELDVRLVRPDGAVRWVRAVGRPVDDGETQEQNQGQQPVRGVLQDITARRHREQDLRIKSQAINASTVGIVITDATEPDTPIIYANEGFTQLTGYTTGEVIGKDWQFLQGADTDEATVDTLRTAVDTATPAQTEILNYRADGTPFWNKVTVTPVSADATDDVTHFVWTHEDVTTRTRQKRLTAVLDRVLRHNVGNDMTVIRGLAETIAERAAADDIARFAERIQQTSDGLFELTQMAREFRTAVQESEPLAPRDVLADIQAVVPGLEAEYPEAEFSVDAPAQATVTATRSLRLALYELGDNAAKHGTSAAVRYRVTTSADGEVAVHVTNDGTAFPEVERQVLEAGHETALDHSSGLGLWLVNWIVTSLNGMVTTTVDEGTTTVTMQFPPASAATDERRLQAALSTDSM